MSNYIFGIVGKQGKGKTWLMTYLAYLEYLNFGRNIFSNYSLKFPYTPVSSISGLQSVRNGVLILDEFWLWLRSRLAMSKTNQEINKVIMLNRKRNVSIIFTAQHPMFVDTDLRRVVNNWFRPNINVVENIPYVEFLISDFLDKKVLGSLIVPYSLDFIGNLYNTNEEIKDLGIENNSYVTGSKNEMDAFHCLQSHPKFLYGNMIPDSGRNSSIDCDIDIQLKDGKRLLIEVKSSTDERISNFRYSKKELLTKINNAKKFNADYCIMYPNPKDHKHLLNRWLIYPMNKGSSIIGMQDPFVNSIIKDSLILKDI